MDRFVEPAGVNLRQLPVQDAAVGASAIEAEFDDVVEASNEVAGIDVDPLLPISAGTVALDALVVPGEGP